MRLKGPAFAAFALITCLQGMTWACSARTPTAVPTPAQTDPQPNSPNTTVLTPEPESAPASHPLPRTAVDECALIDLPGEPIATIGLTDRIDPANALHPSNASERLFFGQLYETLVRVDCMGRVRPGLAASWTLDKTTGRLWFVTLRDDARFSDGTPVTAADVRASWIRNGVDGTVWMHLRRLVDSVDVIDEQTLRIQLPPDKGFDAPVVLAHPELAVAKWVADAPFPLGTRSSRIESRGDAARGAPLSDLTVGRDNRPSLRFLVAPGDPRDLLDAGVDLLLTRDPATLDYAATLPHFQRVPLAWQRTHVLLTSGRSTSSPSLMENTRQALASDAVRGEARGAQGPFWFETTQCHVGPRRGMRSHVPNPRIVYDANDGAARDLAERFVGLVGSSGVATTAVLDAVVPDRPRRTFQRATGLTGEDLANARRIGTDAGYIVSVESRSLEPCHDLLDLMDAAPWLQREMIVPLVDTRLQAIVRRGRSGVAADFDGAVLIDGGNDPR